MGFIFGFLKGIIKLFLHIAVVVAIILLIPNLPPYTKFTSIEIDPTQPRTGALAPNGDLNNAEKLYIDKLLGPETFQLWNGEVYTSLATGEIVKISRGGHVTFVTQIGQPCTGLVDEHICGRPLGFVIDDKNKQMYVADAYYGIWKVDLKSYKKQLLVSPRVEIEGNKPMLFNAVGLANNGDLYWTDSSTEYYLKDGVFAIISDPSGRLLHYNPATNQSTVLLDNLWFPNGLVVSPDNQFVLLAETNHMRVLKYYIDGSKKGLTEVFVSGLPGNPDTVRVLPDGSGVIVSLYTAFDDDNPLLSKSLASTPMARKFVARLMRLLEIPFEFLNTHFPHIIFEQIIYTVGHFVTVSAITPGMSGIVQTDWNGNIVASYFNTDNSIEHISDAIVYNDKLYLGCPHKQNFIASVPVPPLLKKAFDVPQPSPTPIKVKSAAEQKTPSKDKKPTASQPTQNPKRAQTNTEIPPSIKDDKIKTNQQKQPEIKSNTIRKESVEPIVKEEPVRSTPKVPEAKPIKESNPEVPKTKAATASSTKTESQQEAQKKATPETIKTTPTPVPRTESNKETAPKAKANAESKPNVDVKKEAAPQPKVVPESKSKVESKKGDPVTSETKKSDKVETEKKPSNIDKTPPEADTSKSTTSKLAKVKKEKKAKKQPVQDEPQIIVQKVVPDVIPVEEEIPSDTIKPKGEPLKVIKKSGPIEIPTV